MTSSIDIVRAWKDEEYRQSLGAAEIESLPENPAGALRLPNEALGSVVGAGDGWNENSFYPGPCSAQDSIDTCPWNSCEDSCTNGWPCATYDEFICGS